MTKQHILSASALVALSMAVFTHAAAEDSSGTGLKALLPGGITPLMDVSEAKQALTTAGYEDVTKNQRTDMAEFQPAGSTYANNDPVFGKIALPRDRDGGLDKVTVTFDRADKTKIANAGWENEKGGKCYSHVVSAIGEPSSCDSGSENPTRAFSCTWDLSDGLSASAKGGEPRSGGKPYCSIRIFKLSQ